MQTPYDNVPSPLTGSSDNAVLHARLPDNGLNDLQLPTYLAPGSVASILTQDGNQQAAQCLQLPLQQLLQYDMQQASSGHIAQQEPQAYSWPQQQQVNEIDAPPF